MSATDIPDTMHAVAITRPGPPDVLVLEQRPVPMPGPGEVLIKVAAAGVNRPDCLQRRGLYPPPPGVSELPGLEVAGIIVAVGKDVEPEFNGQKVCALLAGGGYAEYSVAPAVQCLPVPDGCSSIEAAALPETFFTVWTNVFDRGGLSAGDSILVHGGASGIGTTAIQMAKASGATVFATVGNDEKRMLCEQLGARAINYQNEKFAEVIKQETCGVDVILDIVGGNYLDDNIKCLANDGCLVIIGILGGAKSELNIGRLLSKRATITTSTLRNRSPGFKGQIAQALQKHIWPHIESGTIRPVIQATMPLADAAKAHEILEANAVLGKIVLVTGH